MASTQEDFILPDSWPSDGLLNALLAEGNLKQETDFVEQFSSGSESDLSPSSGYSTSPFSSPMQSPSIQCDLLISDPSSLSLDDYFPSNPVPPSITEESLDSIIQNIMSSDSSFGYQAEVSGPSLKKRKLADLDSPTPTASPLALVTQQIQQGKKVFLTREQLLQFSSCEFDNYMQILSSNHHLTPEETDKLKKQRRVIKNREYSQSSRQKKRKKMEELEARIQVLEKENDQLKSENQSLKQKIWKIVSAYQRAKFPTTCSDSLLPSPSHLGQQKTNLFSIHSPGPTSSVKATGACLFIVLLSFGLLFTLTGNETRMGGMNDFTPRTGRIILSSEDVNTHWWSTLLSHLSGTMSAIEQSTNQSNYKTDTSLRFITTVTTNIDSSYVDDSPQQSATEQANSWDDTHVCDHETNHWFKASHFAPNQTLVPV